MADKPYLDDTGLLAFWLAIKNYISGAVKVTGVKGNSEGSYRIGNVNITKDNIGLSNVENKSSETIRGELTKSNVTTALGYTPPSSDTNTTYSLTQDATDGHKITLTPSSGTAQTVTIPDNNTWRGIQNNLTSDSTSDSLSAAQGKALANGSARDNTKIPLKTAGGIASCSGGGQNWYCKIATITISAAYINRPIVFEVSGRGKLFTIVQVMFQNTNGTDPTLTNFHTDRDKDFWIKKVATSKWEIYAKYSETYGNYILHRITGSGADIGVTVNMVNIGNSLPDGCTKANYSGSVDYANTSGNAISSISRSGTTFTATRINGETFTFTQQDTTYSAMSSSEIKTGTATTPRTMTAKDLRAGILDLFYPVGSWYITSKTPTEFNPATAWGGTWEYLQEGIFLCSAGTSDAYKPVASGTGAKGGANSVTLTPAQTAMKTHSHQYTKANTATNGKALTANQLPKIEGSFSVRKYANTSGDATTQISGRSGVFTSSTGSTTTYGINSSSAKQVGETDVKLAFGNNETHAHDIGSSTQTTFTNPSNANATSAHENRPLYKPAYMWHRTA